MPLVEFDLAQLATMDNGRLGLTFKQLLKTCESDCKDRPGLLASRSVTLTVKLTPEMADNGELESCNVKHEFDVKLPKRTSKNYNMRAVPGGLLFNDASLDDVRQGTLDMAPQPEGVTDAG